MRLLIFVVFFLVSSLAGAASHILCHETDFQCAKKYVDKYFAGERTFSIDEIIKMLRVMKVNDDAKLSNLLGIALLLKKDDVSANEAEGHLLYAYENGIDIALYNLSELYFLRDDYEKALFFLEEYRRSIKIFTEEQYINYARLYAQVLFLSEKDVCLSLSIFNKIAESDRSGVAYYFIGYDKITSGYVSDGLGYLEKSSNHNNENSLMLLADVYYAGKLLERDISKAKQYYERAASLNNGRAHYNLAMISQQENDAASMRAYLIKAAKLDYKEAILFIKEINKSQ